MNEDSPVKGREGMNCEAMERLLALYAWDELEASEHAAVEEHARGCASCGARLAQESKLRDALTRVERPAHEADVSPALLAQCRSELDEVLDDAAGPRGGRGWLHPLNWLAGSFAGHRAWSAGLLVLLGVALGTAVPRLYQSRTAQEAGTPVKVFASPRISDQELQNMGVAGINWNWAPDSGSGSPNVEVHLTTERPVEVRGSLDDLDVKRVLTFVVQNGQRFDSGIRLDSVEVLRTRSADGEVRRALCTAARKDSNPGVRLKALEALRGFEQDENVRQALLDALEGDSNPGVRVEAINELRAMTERGALGDRRLVSVLRERMQKDPNNYVRLQSAAAIRQMGPRPVH